MPPAAASPLAKDDKRCAANQRSPNGAGVRLRLCDCAALHEGGQSVVKLMVRASAAFHQTISSIAKCFALLNGNLGDTLAFH